MWLERNIPIHSVVRGTVAGIFNSAMELIKVRAQFKGRSSLFVHDLPPPARSRHHGGQTALTAPTEEIDCGVDSYKRPIKWVARAIVSCELYLFCRTG
jgi:hypothetical protein